MFNRLGSTITLSLVLLFSSCAPGTVSIPEIGTHPADSDSAQNQTSVTTSTSVHTNPNTDTSVESSPQDTITTVITISTMITETTIESITVVTTVTETQTLTQTETETHSTTETQSETQTVSQTTSNTATNTGTDSYSNTNTNSYTNTNTNTGGHEDEEEQNNSHKPPKIQLTSEYEISVENEVGQLDLNTLQVNVEAGISYSVSNLPQENILRITTTGEGFVNVMICNTYKVCAEKKLNVKNKKDNSNKKKVAYLEIVHPDGVIDEDDSAPLSGETEEQMIRRRLQRMARSNQKRRSNADLDDLVA